MPNHASEFLNRYGRLFSPSGSSRWLFCLGSVALEKQSIDRNRVRPDSPSIYASRGTVAHAIAAKCLENDISPYKFIGETIVSDDESKFPINVDLEMANAVNTYVEYALHVMHPDFEPIYEIEKQLDLSFISPYMPSGTADFWCYQKKTSTLYVVDYKNGVGDVNPVNNTQMMTYALGVMHKLELYHSIRPHDIKRVILVIAQPNARYASEPIRPWETSVDTLKWFHEFTRTVISSIIKGNDTFAPSESRCQWCRGAGICTAKAKLSIESAKLDFNQLMLYEDQLSEDTSPIGGIVPEVDEPQFPPVDTLSPRELGFVLKWQSRIDKFFADVRKQVLDFKYQGMYVPYVKAVRGLSNRTWKDSDQVEKELIRRYDLSKEEIYTEPKVRSPAQIEAILKKKKLDKSELDDLITRPLGEVKLVPMNDKRPEISLDSSAKQDFIDFKQ
jgi:hypothetical protein